MSGTRPAYRWLLRSVLCLLATTLVLTPASDSQQDNFTFSANYWLPKCNAPIGTIGFAECTAFFHGWDAAKFSYDTLLIFMKQPVRIYCPPTNVSFGQTINIVRAYAARNPHKTHNDFAFLVSAALAEAFPCLR